MTGGPGRTAVVAGTARVDRDTAALLARLSRGDVAVLAVGDLDRATAEELVRVGVTAVVNAGRLSPGRYANLGPRILSDAGVVWLDDVGLEALEVVRDGDQVTVEDGIVQPAGLVGRVLETPGERPDPTTPPSSPSTASREIADRPGPGRLPSLRTAVAGRPVLLVGPARHGDLRSVRRFVRERGPVVVAIDGAADDLVGLSWVPDVVVLSSRGRSGSAAPAAPAAAATPEALSLATDVVEAGDPAERPADLALRLLDRDDAAIVVGVGLPPRVAVPASRAGASGSWLLDGRSLPLLASGRAGPTRVAVLIAALVALGAGIALGTGPLARPTGRAPTVAVGSSASEAEARRAEAADHYAQRFAGTVAGRAYAGGLTGQGVVVISLPGTRGTTVRALTAQVVAASGAATRTIALRASLFDAAGRDEVDTTGSGLAAQLADPRVDASASTYVRLGQLLAVATTTTQPGAVVADPAATAVRDGLEAAGLVDFPPEVRLASLVLVVLPPDAEGAGQNTTDVLAGLLGGVAPGAVGIVVAGDAGSATEGLLAALRRQPAIDRVSTVDGVDDPLGRVTAVLALEALLGGTTGSFGPAGTDGPVPLN